MAGLVPKHFGDRTFSAITVHCQVTLPALTRLATCLGLVSSIDAGPEFDRSQRSDVFPFASSMELVRKKLTGIGICVSS